MNSPVPRRRFLQAAGAAGLSLLGFPAITRSAGSPNERIRIAVMGVHGRGLAHIKGFLAQPNVEIAYVCDVDRRTLPAAVAAAGKTQRSAPKAAVDFREALADPSVDVLSVAAPNHWHAPATILACQAGKHVYVEKPGSHNPREGEWMVAAARQHRRLVQMGNQRRSWPWIQEAVQRIHDGEIGKVTFARTWYHNARPTIGRGRVVPVPGWLHYDQWQGPVDVRPYKDNLIHYNWHWFWHWGNGELGNNGIHALDVARWGLQVDVPQSVSCGGGRYQFDDDQETPDIYRTTFDFGNCGASWESQSHHPYGMEGAGFGIQFFGDQGQLIIAGNNYRVVDPKGRELAKIEASGDDVRHFGNFISAIRGGETLNAEIEEGQKSTLLCHLGNIAWRTQSTLEMNHTGRPENNPEANALWKGAYRGDWERLLST